MAEEEAALMGPTLLKVLIVEYVVLSLAFAWGRDWPRAGYFVGAAVLTWAVLYMK